jgi:AraC family transcriptional regulator
MKIPEVRIVELEAARVAVAYGFGASPESTAWDKILEFARKQDLLEGPYPPRFFGFNHPDPTPASPNYGYEQWIVVHEGIEAVDDIRIKDFKGGLYAVLRFRGLQNFGKAWADLVAWAETSPYKKGNRQCLEELLTLPESMNSPENVVFDIYLAVER